MYHAIEDCKNLAMCRLHRAMQSGDFSTIAKLSKSLEKMVKHKDNIRDTALKLVKDMPGGNDAKKR
jgi:hypothetical protein